MNKTAVIYTPYATNQPGAAGMRAHYLKEALQSNGFTVHILTPAQEKGIGLALKIKSIRPALVLATSPPLPPLLNVFIGTRLVGARFILDAKDDGRFFEIEEKRNRSIKEELFRVVRKIIYRSSDFIWFLTRSDQAIECKRYDIPLEKTACVPNGVDRRLVFDASFRNQLRKEWKVSTTARIAVYAGSLGDEDLTGLLASFEPMRKAKHGLIMVVTADHSAAEAERVERLKQQVENLSSFSFKRVFVNLPIDEMQKILSACDVGIVPWSDHLPTSLPVKTFDYSAAGLPMVIKGPHRQPNELELFAAQNKGWAIFTSDWKMFQRALAALLLKKKTNAERSQRAADAYHQWDRQKIMKGAIEQLEDRFHGTRSQE